MNQMKNKEKAIFLMTIVFMLMLGISFSSINKGLFKEEIIFDIAPVDIPQESFSPEVLISPIPIVLGLILIFLVVWAKEKEIKQRHIDRHLERIGKIIRKKIINFGLYLKSIHNKIENIKGFDVKKATKLKPHKKVKEYYYSKLHKRILNELKNLEDMFIGPYKEEYTDKFIALLFIAATVGISIFAVYSNPGFIVKKDIAPLEIEIVQQQQLSPEITFNIWPILFALVIIAIVSIIKIKREKY